MAFRSPSEPHPAANLRRRRERPEALLPRGVLLLSGAVFTLGAAIIHLVGTPARLAEALPLGAGTALLGGGQLALGLARVVLPSRASC